MAEKITKWDPVDRLRSEEDIAAYLTACAQEEDPELLIAALGDIARARNMMQLAAETKMTRAGLYKALSGKGDPKFSTITKIAEALGLRLEFVVGKKPAARARKTKAA